MLKQSRTLNCTVPLPLWTDKCDKRSVTQMPLMYEQFVPGLGWKLMYCAPGTAYNHTQCSCSNFKPGPIPSSESVCLSVCLYVLSLIHISEPTRR